ncbi:hypothetical protein [Salipiger sp. PrR002]|uniref:hypothetical protein n=1 Tax=Salipiger sp. PrR002 TaxID=2706489 RepID=UPI0013B70D19|nr:hypothetical protein [Salipiger sp. PrR002]NDW02400.1 hypothetical protein [Salipiger sp. PrR002]NDW59488.1 hypothetical protein [Salipiger sp. PrR004]
MLALAPRGTIRRSRLQSLMWSNKEAHFASQSLRSALYALRRDLAKAGGEGLLLSDSASITLQTENLWIDVLALDQPDEMARLRERYGAAVPELLEGLDLRSADDEFEDWLRVQRSHWRERLLEAPTAEAAAPAPPKDPAPHRGAVIGLLPSASQPADSMLRFQADTLLEQLIFGVQHLVPTTINDFRETLPGTVPSDSLHNRPDILLRMSSSCFGNSAGLRLQAFHGGNNSLLWSLSSNPIDKAQMSVESPALARFVGEAMDRICHTLTSPHGLRRDAVISPFHAIVEMFRLDHGALDALKGELQHAYGITRNTTYLSILAYLNTFTVGEHWQSFSPQVAEETADLVARVEAEQPWNGVAMALAGHAKAYVLHDMLGAELLLKRAVEINPYMAISWDHLALHALYTARYDLASTASRRAEALGHCSPLAFTYEQTRCMIDTLEARFDSAAELGQRILARRPRFGAALRYTAISLAHLGKLDEARVLIGRIREMDPDFSPSWVDRNRMAVNDENGRLILSAGLKKAIC